MASSPRLIPLSAGACAAPIAAALLASAGAATAQTVMSIPSSPESIEPAPAFLLDLILPDILRVGYRTRAWVREHLPETGDSLSDLDRLDLIYLGAVDAAAGDLDLALAASLIAVFEHRTIPLSLGIELPLTLEPSDAFRARVARLPVRLFSDTPAGGDRDKLQHFFGSAWLAYALDSRGIADLLGIWVEIGEELFITGGANDRRDIRANRLGHLFATLLRQYPRALPSSLFRAWNREYTRRHGAG